MPITHQELISMLEDEFTSERELRQYLMVDENSSRMFHPKIVANPETVVLPARSDDIRIQGEILMRVFNDYSKARRKRRFERMIRGGHRGPVIVSEGDSWFQYPLLLEDTIDHLYDMGYAIRSLDAAGDTLEQMLNHREYLEALVDTKASIFMLSAGGNDALGGGNLAKLLKPYDPNKPAQWHVSDAFDDVLDKAMGMYDQILKDVVGNTAAITLIHGYDYVIPNDGNWLGEPMAEQGIHERALQREIAGVLIDKLNERLQGLATGYQGRVIQVNVRNTVGGTPNDWHDEIHPTDEGYFRVARKFHEAIKKTTGAL